MYSYSYLLWWKHLPFILIVKNYALQPKCLVKKKKHVSGESNYYLRLNRKRNIFSRGIYLHQSIEFLKEFHDSRPFSLFSSSSLSICSLHRCSTILGLFRSFLSGIQFHNILVDLVITIHTRCPIYFNPRYFNSWRGFWVLDLFPLNKFPILWRHRISLVVLFSHRPP